jgi:hypothetical protein
VAANFSDHPLRALRFHPLVFHLFDDVEEGGREFESRIYILPRAKILRDFSVELKQRALFTENLMLFEFELTNALLLS